MADDGVRRISQALSKGGIVPIEPSYSVIDSMSGSVVASGLSKQGAQNMASGRDGLKVRKSR